MTNPLRQEFEETLKKSLLNENHKERGYSPNYIYNQVMPVFDKILTAAKREGAIEERRQIRGEYGKKCLQHPEEPGTKEWYKSRFQFLYELIKGEEYDWTLTSESEQP